MRSETFVALISLALLAFASLAAAATTAEQWQALTTGGLHAARDLGESNGPCEGIFIFNGNITTFDSGNPSATLLLISGNNIAYVGNSYGQLAQTRNSLPCEVIDAEGKRVGPAIYDGHVHLLRAALDPGCQVFDAEQARTTSQLLTTVANGISDCESGELITVTGGITAAGMGGFPTLTQLDAILPSQPFLMVQRYQVPDAFTLFLNGPGVANTVARNQLLAAGIWVETDGSIAAVNTTAAINYYRGTESETDRTRHVVRTFKYLNRWGEIGGLDMAGFFFTVPNDYRFVSNLYRQRELSVSVGLGLDAQNLGLDPILRVGISRLGSQPGRDDNLYTAGIGENTLAFPDRSNVTRVINLLESVRNSYQGNEWFVTSGLENPTHTSVFIAALMAVESTVGIPTELWGVEHCYGCNRSTLEYLDEKRVFVGMDGSRFLFGRSDSYAMGLPPLRTALNVSEDALLTLGTDGRNVAPLNFWISAQFWVDGKNVTGQDIGGGETITIDQVYYYSTVGNARKVRQLDFRGNLVQGKLADLVIWKQDPLTVATDQIRFTEASKTFLRGRLVYDENDV